MAKGMSFAFDEFTPEVVDWSDYVERLGHVFITNKIEDAPLKKSYLLSVVGFKTYKLIKNLAAPKEINDVSYDEIVKLVKEYYCPRPSTIVQRYKFNTCVRLPSETVAAFVARLREISQHCDYGVSLDDLLRDRIVCGIGDERIQRRLLSETDLTLKRVLEISQGVETAAQYSKELVKSSSQPVQKCEVVHDRKSPRKCYRCGGVHNPATCRFKDEECHSCQKMGHISKMCKSKHQQSSSKDKKSYSYKSASRGRGKVKFSSKNHFLFDQESEPEYELFMFRNSKVAPFYIDMHVHKKKLRMEVDTGAALSLISYSTYLATWKEEDRPPLQEFKHNLHTYTGENIKVRGLLTTDVLYKDKCLEVSLVVVNEEGPSLIGRDWITSLKIDLSEIASVNRVSLDDVCDKYSEVFAEELGAYTGPEVQIRVDSNAVPRFMKARTVPYALLSSVENELDRLVSDGVLEPVTSSEWASPIVTVVKSSNKVRICGDYKMTVNPYNLQDNYPIPKSSDLFAKLAGGTVFSKLD